VQQSPDLIRIQGVDIEFVERGHGPPLLFLHDELGPDADSEFIEALARRFRVIAPSHPGFGRSSLPDSFDSVDDIAFFYLDLLDQLDLTNVTLAGASFGGWLAAEVAVRCCHRLRRLALIDPIGIKVGGRDARDIADIFSLPPALVAQLTYHQPSSIDFKSMSEEELAKIARNRESFALFAWEPFAHSPKLRSRLHRISVPALILWGASDGIVTLEYAQTYRDAIPAARLEIVADAGHLPHREQPLATVDRLFEFVNS
jgi:pimeloyl-ACP methyl ester carboxylesterase